MKYIKKHALLLAFSLLSITGFSQSFDEIIKTVASDRGAGDYFGYSVSISGDYAIVGANEEDEDTAGANLLGGAGSAYIFERDGSGNWSEKQKIVASDRGAGDYFGWSVSISGNYVIVGAIHEDHDSAGANLLNSAGSAYIFERDGSGNWSEKQKIVASDRDAHDNFGYSVSISGNYAIVGAHSEDHDTAGLGSLDRAGSGYIFERDGSGNWIEQQKIVASDRGVEDHFGYSVSISGSYAIVGAYNEDHNVAGVDSLRNTGSAYIFERDGSGNWIEQQKIVASDRGRGDNFGISVSISGDYAIVGAYYEDHDTSGLDSLNAAGSAYIFERDGSGNWIEQQKIVASDRGVDDSFGNSVSISGDYAIVGAFYETHDTAGANPISYAGSAYIFERDGSGNWSEQQKIVASDREDSDVFGVSVSISGGYTIVGAYLEDHDTAGANLLVDAGSAYIFGTCMPTISTFNVTATQCTGYTLPSGDSTYTTVGTYTINDTINNAGGCDSVMTITITVLPIPTATIDTTINTGESITVGTSTYSTTGTYIDTLTNGQNCDSIITTNLSVINGVNSSLLNGLSVYPNPTEGNFLLEFESIQEHLSVQLFSIEGQLISTKTVRNSKRVGLFIDQPADIYFLNVTDQNDSKVVLKIIKK